MISLQVRMALLVAALFAIIYGIITMAGTYMGVTNFYFYLILSFGIMLVQYLLGPKIIEWTMRVKYIQKQESPALFAMVEQQAQMAGIPMPKICIMDSPVPNAFAFGRGQKDGRVCVSSGIMSLLSHEELRAVIGHELTHIKNRDVLTITLLSVIPMILYRIAWHFLFYGGGRRSDRGNNTVLIGIAAMLFYFVTNLLVLYGSRIREYYADKGSVELGNPPSALASALYKLVYGSARVDREAIRETEGIKAFFINDPSRAMQEIRELSQLDLDKSGTIDAMELNSLKNKTLKLGFGDYMMEAMSTHPNMLKRIQHLSSLGLGRSL